jgi:hypothetical protein
VAGCGLSQVPLNALTSHVFAYTFGVSIMALNNQCFVTSFDYSFEQQEFSDINSPMVSINVRSRYLKPGILPDNLALSVKYGWLRYG